MTKRSFTRTVVIGLLAALATTYSVAQSTPSIVGTWETLVTPVPGSPGASFEAVLTFFADGNMVEVSDENPGTAAPGHGTWIGSGKTFWTTFILFVFDRNHNNTGKVKTYLSINMVDPNRFTCTVSVDLIDLKGKVTKSTDSSTCESTRLEAGQP